MKKKLAIALAAAALIASLAGCGEAGDGAVTDAPVPTAAHTVTHTPTHSSAMPAVTLLLRRKNTPPPDKRRGIFAFL